MPYCMYLRKSRADKELEARGEGETLSRHERALQMLATRLGLPVAAVYREIVSGETISSRPVMQTLLSEVEQGAWDGVFVMEVERLARGDTIDQGIVAQAFRCTNTRILTPAKIYDPSNESDEEYFEFGLFMSRREYKTINRRMQSGRLASVREGKYVGNIAPFGYDRVRLPDQKGFTLEPNKEANAVRLIFSLFCQRGCTIREIVSLINDQKEYRPRKAASFTYSSIHDILENPVYIGKLRWNYRKTTPQLKDGVLTRHRPRQSEYLLVQGLHPALISEECFFLAQRLLHPDSGQKNSPIWK